MTARIVVIDDHQVLVQGLRLLLERSGRYKVVGEAASATDAVRLIRRVQPDLILLDLSLPGGSGLSVIRRLSAHAAVVVLTMHDDLTYVRQAVQLGARGYIIKEASSEELLLALDSVLKGDLFIHPRLAAKLLPIPEPRSAVGYPRLSKRETQVLKLLCLGYMNREIAAELGVSVRTVETYKNRLMAKLGLTTRAELVGYALEEGLI